MSKLKMGLTAAALAALLATAADAQSLSMRKTLTLSVAKLIAEATLECGSKDNYHTAAVVVDRDGNVLVTLRDEMTTKQTGELARRKAYTSAMYRRSTLDWVKRMQDDPTLLPQRDQADVIALAGGVPIMVGDDTIGAVGSAGSTQPMDDSCAHAGVNKVANLLK